MLDSPPCSLLGWFLLRAYRSPERTVLRLPSAGGYYERSWGEWAEQVFRATAALEAWGVRPGDRVAQLSENRDEWLTVDLAIQAAGAVHVPLHSQLPAAQAAREILHSGARYALVSSVEQARKLAPLARRSSAADPTLRLAIYDAPPPGEWLDGGGEPDVEPSSWGAASGAADGRRGERLVERAAADNAPDRILKILYTSGTTGDPKGVQLTAGNLLSNAVALADVYGDRPDECKLNFLPLSHVFAQTNDFYSTLVAGCELGLARSRDTLLDDCRQVRPTLLNGVPSVYERIWNRLVEAGAADRPGTLRELLGGRIELCNAGGAPLSERLYDAYGRHGVRLLQGYGLTETSPVICVSTPAADRRGCVGRPIAGVEVRIAEDGEVLTRGPHVTPGYYRDAAATAEAIRDGWFATGDLGRLEDGFLRITGRKKELIVLANGKKVSPTQVETALRNDPLVVQAVVVGEGRTSLAALVTLDPNLVAAERPPESAPDRQNWLSSRLAGVQADLAPWEQVRRWIELDRPLTVEAGELTAKLSVRRAIVEARYAERIAAAYAARETPVDPADRA